MPEITFFCQKLKSVCVDSFGKVTLPEVGQSIKECAELLKEHGCSQLIVDVRKQEVTLELVDTFDLCKTLIPQLPIDLRIAYIVNDPPQQSHRFFNLMSNSLGYPVNAFYSIKNGMAWFEGKESLAVYPSLGKVKFPG